MGTDILYTVISPYMGWVAEPPKFGGSGFFFLREAAAPGAAAALKKGCKQKNGSTHTVLRLF